MPQPSVLILGSEGMLGQACMRWLGRRTDWTVRGTKYDDRSHPLFFDALGNLEALRSVLTQGNYQYAINCIGALSAAIDEKDCLSVEKAIRINALFPHQLARLAAEKDVRVIHISTDGVFSGNSELPYTEASPTDCHDVYGKTKALGECVAANVINIRCSIVGRDWHGGKGIIEWFLRLPPGASVTGFTDYVWTGVTTFQFAQLCEQIVEQNAFERLRAESAIHHFAPNRALTKHQFLILLKEVTGKTIDIRAGTSPRGPCRRVLTSRLQGLRALYRPAGDWADLLREVLEDSHAVSKAQATPH